MSRYRSRPRFTTLRTSVAPLGFRNFALYWLGFTTSNTGRWIELTGAVWLAYELTNSPFQLGLIGLARAVPVALLSPFAGVLADRVDQRRMLMAVQVLGLIAPLVLGLLVITGYVEVWHLYLQVAIQAMVQAFDASIRQALFPRLVPRGYLAEAVTLQAMAGRTSSLIGPSVGGLAIATWGEAAPFLLNAATFPVLFLAVVLMRGVVPRSPIEGSTFRGDLIEGLRYVLRAPVISGLLKLEVAFGLLQVNPVIITIIGREVLGVGPEGLGGLLSAQALGALLGIGGLLAVGQPRRQGRFVVVCQLAYAASIVGFAVSQDYRISFLVLAASGALDSLASVTRNSVMQLAAPGRMRGRVMANLGTVIRGTQPLSQTQSGFLAGVLGPSSAVIASAIALALAASAIGRSNHSLWAFTRDDHRATPAETAATLSSPEQAVQ